MENLTKWEIKTARKLGVSSADVHRVGANSFGVVYGLYNDYYYIAHTFNGYSKAEIYRALLRDLIEKIGVFS